MNKIDITSWSEFHLYDLFEIDSGNKFDRSKMDNSSQIINFIGRTGINNGINAVVNYYKNTKPYPAGYLTLALGGSVGACFVQEKEFYTSQNVVVLIPKFEMTDSVKRFIATVIYKESSLHYQAFVKELNAHIKTDFVIKLPIKNGKIDFEFMNNYYESQKKLIIDNINKITKEISVNKKTININNWNEFKVKDIFEMKNGKGITTYEIYEHPGNLKAIQSGEENFGCIGYIDYDYCVDKKYSICEKPCLTVARSGSAGFVGIQSEPCVVGDSAKLLIPIHDISLNCLVFLRSVLMILKKKYSYNDKVTESKYMNEIIKLPVDKNGNPDWIYMDNYIKTLPLEDILGDINK